MPTHKRFVHEYGKSASYAIKKRRKQRPRRNFIIDDDDDQCLAPSDAISSASENGSQSIGNQSPNRIFDDVNGGNDDDGIEDVPQESHSSSQSDSESEHLLFDDGTDVAFDDRNSDDEYDDAENGGEEEPLFVGASITLGQSMLSILSFALCHNLTGTALADLLVLICLLCGQTCTLKPSLYLFRKHFNSIRYPLIKHYYCSVCCSALATSTSVCEISCEHSGVSYFIEISIMRQLQMLYDRPGFYESLQHRFHREKNHPLNRDDIYDGDVYRELCRDHGFLATPSNISFSWNTDGVSIFKSSGFQIWPFYLSINELPYRERTKPENIILAGLWFGPQKPLPNFFMQPFHTALEEVLQGVDLNVPNRELPVKVKGMVICGTCDLPAKALFLNVTQFNGRYGCPKCKLRGQAQDGVWTYPFERELNQRTEDESRDYAEEALRRNAPVFGIKGPSILDLFVYKYIRTTAVDSMHCVFAGVTKKLLSFFFDPAFSGHSVSLAHSIDLVDCRLRTISPPSFLQRRPRSIKRHLKYWKANELKAWLFYYSIPILYDIIVSPEYFEHYCMFVLAIYALHQPSVSPAMLEKATKLLVEFANRFDVLYGARYMSANLHQILHLPETVRDFGPLWVTSCFPFEDLNGKLKRFVHSSHHPELQICNAVSSFLNLTALRKKILVPGSGPYLYCATLASAKKNMRLEYVSEGIKIVGRCKDMLILSEIVESALGRAAILGRKFKLVSRLMKDNSLYTSEAYTRSVKYNNTCVRFNHNEVESIGIIHSFIKVFNCECQIENACECYAPIYAIIRECNVISIIPQSIQEHLPKLVFKYTGLAHHAIAVHVQELVSVCVLLRIEDQHTGYVVIPANTIENE